MKKYLSIVVILLLVAAAAGWFWFSKTPRQANATENAAPKGNRLIITGSSTLAPAMTAIARRFETAHPGLHIEVATGGTARGAADVMAGLADIGMLSRGLTPMENALSAFTVGYDGVCLLVHHSNRVESLGLEQIRGIFTGKIRNWNEVAGANAPITYIHRAQGRAERTQFMEHFKILESDFQDSVTVGDNGQAVTTILGNADAIVYMSTGIATVHADPGSHVKILPLNGIKPTRENIQNGTYPFVRPLNLVVKGAPTALQKEFIDFTLSPEGQACISANNFIPVTR
jgi:phosphate transport system substrate-binding protein